jgi:endonuclease/exonuclease/phosphatase family metal-dependent hydrolase
MAAIADIIRKEAPDIVALQEVTSELEIVLLSMPALGVYREVPAPRSSARYYTLLLAHEKIQWCTGVRESFPSSRHARDRLMGKLEWCGVPLQITNVHLESPDAQTWGPDSLGSAERRQQLTKVLADLCQDADALVIGDFNWIPSDGPFPTLPLGAIDVWEKLHPGDLGLTFDAERNGCVRSNHSGRADRVLFGARLLSPCAARLVGTEALSAARQPSGRPVMPSDHFGLVLDFCISSTPEPLVGWTSTEPQPAVVAEAEVTGGWICETCGFHNRARNMMCGGIGHLGCKAPRQGVQSSQHPVNGQPFLPLGIDAVTWMCACGFRNRVGNTVCGGTTGSLGCKAPRPEASQQDSAANSSPSVKIAADLLHDAKWMCVCGFRNRAPNTVCGGIKGTMGCKTPKPKE